MTEPRRHVPDESDDMPARRSDEEMRNRRDDDPSPTPRPADQKEEDDPARRER